MKTIITRSSRASQALGPALAAVMLLAASCAGVPRAPEGLPPQSLGPRSYRLDFSAPPTGGGLDGVRLADGSLTLGAGAKRGGYESPAFAVKGFDWLVPSWDARASGGATVSLSVRVRVGAAWSEWLSFGSWGDEARSAAKQSDALGRVDIDTLLLYAPADGLKWRIELAAGEPGSPPPVVRSVSWVARDRFAPSAPEPSTYPESAISLPSRSQMIEDPAIAGKICSPSSLAMVLEALGTSLPTAELAWLCYDAGAGIFGNWSLNAARASALGHRARVDYLDGIGELAAELAKGRPVVASVRYEKGALDGAAVASTDGHLVAVRGLARRGDEWYVLVNDPASGDVAGVPREYRAGQFKNAWSGVVYLFD